MTKCAYVRSFKKLRTAFVMIKWYDEYPAQTVLVTDIAKKLLENLEKILTTVYDLARSKKLTAQLPFTLTKRKATTEAEKRTAKIFTYDPDEYNTQVLLETKSRKWKNEPSSFWIQFQEHQSFKFDNPQHRVIFACLQLEQTDAHVRILRRFYCVVLYQLREGQAQNEEADAIGQSLHAFLHPKGSGNKATVQALIDSIGNLIQAGSRYHNIAKRLGVGSLFLLGQEIARTT
jgi:hypothetical protein